MVMVLAPLWWLLVDPDRSTAPAKPIHIAELRALAASISGPRPTAATYTLLATRMVSGDFFAAGIGLKRRALAVVTWTLPVPGRRPIMIDPGIPALEAGVGRFGKFDTTRQERIAAQASTAGLVLYTQGHERELPRPRSRLGKAGRTAAPAAGHASLPNSDTAAQAVAPGVVIIPASSHAPGARLIYVQLADGHEFLFAGSIATLRENWARLRARSHLAAAWGPDQDRAETYAWLRTIRQLKLETPTMRIVPGHDYTWLVLHRDTGDVAEFLPGPAPPPKAKPPAARARR